MTPRSWLSGSSICRSAGLSPPGKIRRAALAAVLALVCAAVPPATASAQRAMPQYLRDTWESDQKFPGGPVHAIAQTADGYLWIGAEKGLVRFDGLTFRLLEPRSAATNAGPTVLGITAAGDGTLWARLRGVALLRYRNGAFESLLSQVGTPESVVSAMTRGREDTILLSTLRRGLVVARGGRFDVLAEAGAMPTSSLVIAIAEASNGEIWLGTRDAGLLRVQGSRITRVSDG